MKGKDIAALLLLAALWGGSFLFMRVAAPVLGPVWLIEIRVLLAGIALLPLFIRANLWDVTRRKAVPLFVVGIINSAIPFLLFAFASISLPAGFTAILNATAPLFGTIVAATWLGEKLTLSRTIGFVLGFVGVTVLVGWNIAAVSPGFWLAIAAGLTGALLYAIAAPYTKQQLTGVSPIAIATISQFSAAIFLIPALPFTVPQAMPAAKIWLAVIALALFSTSIAYLLYFRLIQNIGSTKALTVTYLIPVSAIIWGAIALGEPITGAMVFGGGLVLLGTAIANDLFKKLKPQK